MEEMLKHHGVPVAFLRFKVNTEKSSREFIQCILSLGKKRTSHSVCFYLI